VKKVKCLTSTLAMYLHRRKKMKGCGIFQAVAYKFKPLVQ
jgi:hypothetical protein